MMKHVLQSTKYFPVNSTLNNTIVSYFTVDVFEWVKNPNSTLTQLKKGAIHMSCYSPYFIAALSMRLIANGGWGPTTTITMTISKIYTLMVLQGHLIDSSSCSPSNSAYFSGLLVDIGFYAEVAPGGFVNCLVYAHVTYTVGVAVCESCHLLTALTTVQHDTALHLEADSMMAETLAIMPLLMTYIRIYHKAFL
jgi:hypothetical protein